jgi:hypothetical protein
MVIWILPVRHQDEIQVLADRQRSPAGHPAISGV